MVCKGKLLEAVKLEPKYVNFARIPGTSPEQRHLSVTRADGGPLQLSAPSDLPQGVGVEIKEIKPGDQYDVLIILTPPLKPGRFFNNLAFKTGLSEAPTFTVPVFATIAGPPVVRPTRGSPPAGGDAAAKQAQGAPSTPHP